MKVRTLKIYLCLIVVLVTFISCQRTTPILNVTQMAEEIIPDAGVISSSWQGNSSRIIFIFEESHISRVGQIEIALMLTRLHNRYRVDTIALEGAFVENGTVESEWFHNLPDGYIREEVALQLLREGEISGAEFIALAIPDVNVHGVEKEEEYTFEISPLDESAAIVYLFAISERLFPKDEDKIAKVNKLAEEVEKASDKDKPAKFKELMDYMISANQWTKERYENLMMENKIISIEELLDNLYEIKDKAEEVNAEVGQYEENFNRLVEFYKRASKRTETMIANTLKLFDKKGRVTIIPLIMGAAHTDRASEMLRKQGISYAVIRPIALDKRRDIGDLTMDAFERKRRKLSVDDKGLVGSFLDARDTQWKPAPVVGEIWCRSKSELYYITAFLARAAAGGDEPPFSDLENELSQLTHVRINPESLQIIEGEVIFEVLVQTNRPNYWETLWVRTVMISHEEEKTLEERLKEILEEAREKGMPIEGVAIFTQQEYREFLEKFPKSRAILESVVETKDNNVYLDLRRISESQRENLGKEAFEEIVKHILEGGLAIKKVSRNTIAAFSRELPVITAVRLSG